MDFRIKYSIEFPYIAIEADANTQIRNLIDINGSIIAGGMLYDTEVLKHLKPGRYINIGIYIPEWFYLYFKILEGIKNLAKEDSISAGILAYSQEKKSTFYTILTLIIYVRNLEIKIGIIPMRFYYGE